MHSRLKDKHQHSLLLPQQTSKQIKLQVEIRENFKERGEQYRTIWDNMEIGETMICLHLKPD